jgi:phosphoribosyl-ATP pyrophosphohydrolase/phosphoribosyl-AMP cyclohydrolase
MDLSTVKLDEQGLVPVVAQDSVTGQVLMVAWANHQALIETLRSGRAFFYSRSREELWKKGESSGNILSVQEVWVDCDGDTVIYRVQPQGPSCHTGSPTCFFRRLDEGTRLFENAPGNVLQALDDVFEDRSKKDPKASYVAQLLNNPEKARGKILEEAGELCEAISSESKERVVKEVADLIFHALVAAKGRRVDSLDVMQELSRRFGISGHVEKALRRTS